MIRQEIRHFHVCCGAGGGAKGFNRGQARVGAVVAAPRCIGAVDVDPAGIADFDRVAGVRGTVLDLFTREQFVAFHGRQPGPGWREAVPDDFRRAAHGERPHVVFMSTPCKGFSGLLSDKISGTARYQALNGLTLRAVWLTLEAWAGDPPEFILFENVPRIATRGRWLLDQIGALLAAYGYVFAETTHDCGVIGGLAQSRKRFLLVARHQAKVPPFLYEPPQRRLRGVGEVLGRLPLPGDLSVGPMHRVPSLQWKTWVRLAFVEAGSDWRSLNKLHVEGGHLADFGIAPEAGWHAGVLGVQRWDETAGTVTGRGSPTTGTFAVADPRVDGYERSVQMGVRAWDAVAGTVTGNMAVGAGPNAVADPRLQGPPRFNNVYRIVPWAGTSPAVAGPGGPGGGLAVADPRADAGFGGAGKYRVTAYDEAAGTVIGASTTGQGAFALADPRPARAWQDQILGVLPFDEPAGAITAKAEATTGRFSVADPRMTWADSAHRNKLKVVGYDEPAGCVTGADRVGSGALCVADPRPDFARGGRAAYQTGGHYGVTPWDAPSGAVTGSGQHDNGRWSVADPRPAEGETAAALPAADDRLVAVIRALDGTWHRPFTTYELAALQSYVDPEDPAPLVMEGISDSAWRERIGNMVPPASAEAIMGVIARTLLLAWAGETFLLSNEPIWVRPVAIAAAMELPLLGGDP
ncbi:DNA cytosine methyltransferase [Methylobacterium nodulans]|uniref:C-5 cytosine-specific DNA methylase n=1 Tax=Methylobacterium nodulans (strain LMG 21967 / CNCM I-2342 / ORS 2060) TaxID=460265 RepID=B8IH13_METNO|nr:DNA cytosine methyltransferase [Methylobacterium nodulans]ACL57888.1 C-5 cytosine-specific DNA methylase [Methylobacterium nodulans ORS 2060]